MNARATDPTDDAGIDDHIQSVSGLSDSLLKQLRQSLQKIDEINRITRIISMNARIEAVRIGTAGRSFGVIAEEMDTLARRVSDTAQDIDRMAVRTSHDLRERLDQLQTDVRRTRLTDLALANIDLIDRNLYERSCDVRWWATDAAVVAAAQDPQPAALAHASQRLGQILDSYTVYFDLVLADLQGNIIANGRPRQYRSTGQSAAQQAWFQSAMATHSGEQFGFQSMHASPWPAESAYWCTPAPCAKAAAWREDRWACWASCSAGMRWRRPSWNAPCCRTPNGAAVASASSTDKAMCWPTPRAEMPRRRGWTSQGGRPCSHRPGLRPIWSSRGAPAVWRRRPPPGTKPTARGGTA